MGKLDDLLGCVLEYEHHLNEGRVTEASIGFKLLNDLFEWRMLMFIRFKGGCDDAPEESKKRRVPRKVTAHDDRIDEQPDEVFELHFISSRDRRSNQYV